MEEQHTLEKVLRGWIDERAVRSQYRLISYEAERIEQPVRAALDEVSGWNKYFLHYIQRNSEELRKSKGGFLLTGPSGCGKRTAATAAAMYLAVEEYWFENYGESSAEKDGPFAVLYISAADLISQKPSPEECMEYLLDCYLNQDEAGGVCLILEEPEALPEYERFLETLGYMLMSYRCRPETNLLLFFIVSEKLNEDALPAILRNQMQVCRMQPPNTERRKAFWRCAGKRDENIQFWMNGRSEETMAELTEGMTYRQLSDLIQSISWAVKSGNKDIAEEQLVCEQQIRKAKLPQTDEKTLLYRKIGDLLDELPDLAERFIDVVGSISISAGSYPMMSSDSFESENEQRNFGVKDALGEESRFLKEGVDEAALMKGNGLNDAFDREKFRQDIADKKLADILPPLNPKTR